MMYVDFSAGGTEYKLRLNVRKLVVLEKQLGCNPLAIFGSNGDQIPTVTQMVTIFHASLQQYHHNISLNNAYDIFDEFLENHTITDFLPILIELYKVSGLIPTGDSEKN